MSTAYHLCQPEDLDLLISLALRRTEEAGADYEEETLRAGYAPLCAGGSEGAAYLFGPARAPVGYLAITFGWSVPLAAPEARIVDMYIRPSVRRRGLAGEALRAVSRGLREGGIKAIHVELPHGNAPVSALIRRAGFVADAGAIRATRLL